MSLQTSQKDRPGRPPASQLIDSSWHCAGATEKYPPCFARRPAAKFSWLSRKHFGSLCLRMQTLLMLSCNKRNNTLWNELNEHDLLGHPVLSQPIRYKGAFGLPSAMASIFFSRTMILSSQQVSKTSNLIQNASLRSSSRFKMMRRTTALISCQRLSHTMKSSSLSQFPKTKDGKTGQRWAKQQLSFQACPPPSPRMRRLSLIEYSSFPTWCLLRNRALFCHAATQFRALSQFSKPMNTNEYKYRKIYRNRNTIQCSYRLCQLESMPNPSQPSRTAAPGRDRQPLRWLCHKIVTLWHGFWLQLTSKTSETSVLHSQSFSLCRRSLGMTWRKLCGRWHFISTLWYSKVCMYTRNLLIMRVLEHAQALIHCGVGVGQ